ncbi:hypothetical protein HDV03_003241 [Kappamyces sp. JEL0829]|nr:hypothetical protein HDV03_003241 [Kappamyces sp. JEL0829]
MKLLDVPQSDLWRLEKTAGLYYAADDAAVLPFTPSALVQDCTAVSLQRSAGDESFEDMDSSIVEAIRMHSPDRVYLSLAPSGLEKRSQPSSSNLLIPYSKRFVANKYYFVNTPILMGIFCMAIVVGIALFGAYNLASLQTPTRFENPAQKKRDS